MKRIMRRILPLLLLPAAACGTAEQPRGGPVQGDVPLYDNLGTHSYAVTTSVPLAQRYFDQGLRLYYAFNHAESIRAFEEAARRDPNCAMCQWGAALAWGPNINLPMDSAGGVAAWHALQRAVAVQERASEVERGLIQALSHRYVAAPPSDRATLDSAYSRAMVELAARFPEDAEVATLAAEAIMVLSPWQYWERDGSARPGTQDVLRHLDRALAAMPEHPGANHFYIHAVEAVDPQRALPMAERLAGLMPGAGHLVHMPGHIYVRVGRYLDAIRANEHAVHADETFIRDHNPAVGVYTVGYYPHNYDFLAFAASMIGRMRQSLDAADRMAALVPREMLGLPGFTVLQNHMSRGLQFRVRFALWEEILQTPAPEGDVPYALAIWHYATGRALAALGDVSAADAALAGLREAASHPSLTDAGVEFNGAVALLAIAADVLAGHIAAARGDFNLAIALLSDAVEKEDDLIYGEPPEWSVPVRQELGNVLLDAGRAAEAEVRFREDLARFPVNGWSLAGLARSLDAQGRAAEAADARALRATTWEGR